MFMGARGGTGKLALSEKIVGERQTETKVYDES